MIGLFLFLFCLWNILISFSSAAPPSGVVPHARGTGNQVVEPEEVDIGIPGDRVDSKRGG